MMRQSCKQMLTIAAWLWMSCAAFAGGLVDTIVINPLTGVAIEGYDAVSYFTGAEPELGSPDYEYDWAGVPWYFASAANRDVFMRNPEIYAPQYGGHCAISLSRGYLSDGKPRLYAIVGLKLYFFYSTANRDAFLMSPQGALQTAESNWPNLRQELIGPIVQTAQVASNAEPASVVPATASAETVPPIPGVESSNALVNAAESHDTASIAPDGASSHVQPH